MIKKTIYTILLIVITFVLASCDIERTYKVDGVVYRVWNYTEIAVIGYDQASDTKNLIIPNRIEHESVDASAYLTGIRSEAFRDNEIIESVQIDNLADQFYDVGSYAFYNAKSLNRISLPASTKYIAPFAFYNNSEDFIFIIYALEPPFLANNNFEGIENLKIYVPQEALISYQLNDEWQPFYDQIFTIESM